MQEMLQQFMFFYNGLESRPIFAMVEEMLQWTGLYGLTRRTLEEELLHAGLNTQTIAELVTVCFSSIPVLSFLLSSHMPSMLPWFSGI